MTGWPGEIHPIAESIHGPPGQIHSIAESIHGPPGQIHSIAERIHGPPGQIHPIPRSHSPVLQVGFSRPRNAFTHLQVRFTPSRDRIHGPRDQIHPIADRIDLSPGRIHPIVGQMNLIGRTGECDPGIDSCDRGLDERRPRPACARRPVSLRPPGSSSVGRRGSCLRAGGALVQPGSGAASPAGPSRASAKPGSAEQRAPRRSRWPHPPARGPEGRRRSSDADGRTTATGRPGTGEVERGVVEPPSLRQTGRRVGAKRLFETERPRVQAP
ncbi:MAG: hypothetical protein JWN02_2381 [Acidobacteria bacterium]|nr:hypothetical protein [Acidobacteriota bacterium]